MGTKQLDKNVRVVMLDKPIGTGTTIRRLDDGIFTIKNSNLGSASGNSERIREIAINLGLQKPDVNEAFHNLIHSEHNVANFGMFGTLIYTMREERTMEDI